MPLQETPGRKEKFLVARAAGGSVESASKMAGVSRTTVYRWRRQDLEFSERWNAIENAAEAELEDNVAVARSVAFRKAFAGNEAMLRLVLTKYDRYAMVEDPELVDEVGELEIYFHDDGRKVEFFEVHEAGDQRTPGTGTDTQE